MHITKEEIARYLAEVFVAVRAGNYQISPRPKNHEIYEDYVFVISLHKQEHPLEYKFK